MFNFRVYYKENSLGLEMTKDFIYRKEVLDFLDSKNRRGYVVLLGKFKIGKN